MLLLWLAVVGAGARIVWLLAALLVPRGERLAVLVLLLGVSAIAAAAGITGGLSREAAVGDIVAAALGLFGGVIVYLFGVDRSKGVIGSCCGIAFSLTLTVAYFEAAARRGAPESYALWRDKCIEKFTDKDLLGDPVAFAFLDGSMGKLCAEIFIREKVRLLGQAAAAAS